MTSRLPIAWAHSWPEPSKPLEAVRVSIPPKSSETISRSISPGRTNRSPSCCSDISIPSIPLGTLAQNALPLGRRPAARPRRARHEIGRRAHALRDGSNKGMARISTAAGHRFSGLRRRSRQRFFPQDHRRVWRASQQRCWFSSPPQVCEGPSRLPAKESAITPLPSRRSRARWARSRQRTQRNRRTRPSDHRRLQVQRSEARSVGQSRRDPRRHAHQCRRRRGHG